MDKFNELFDIVEPNFEKGEYSKECPWLWIGSYSGKWKFKLRKPRLISNFCILKNAVKSNKVV